jgi:hypothetical protein
MRAYKFLTAGGEGPLTGFHWPLPEGGAPGAWVETEGPLGACRRGAHVCLASDLPYWIGEELWEVEASGDQVEGVDCLVVRRARLVREVTAWREGAVQFAAYAVAVLAPNAERMARYRKERAWQAALLSASVLGSGG